jgi:hypothetical protein
MGEVHNTQSIIDSREVIARIEELEASGVEQGTDEGDEYEALKDFAEEGESLSDWEYGEALIHEDYFEEYAEELAEDLGLIDREAGWPVTYIDWERAADALKQDYTELNFDGEIYWGRS